MDGLAIVLLIAASCLAAILGYDLLYRLFCIYPKTHYSGRFAAFIEHNHIYRWLMPAIAGKLGPIDIFFAGNSHVMDGIDPSIIHQKTGYRAYNLALYSLPSQHGVELLLRHGTAPFPKLVLIDFSSRYSLFSPKHRLYKLAEDALSMSRWERTGYAFIDRFHWVLPSLMIPAAYRNVIQRSLDKYQKFKQTGHMGFGRYTPFQPFLSYEWQLEKSTNHRIARHIRPKSAYEKAYEQYLLQKCLDESPKRCDVEQVAYKRGMKRTRSMIQDLQHRGIVVVLMRMPLCKRVIEYENKHCTQFFQDVQAIAADLNLTYLDLNAPDHQAQLGQLTFYNDGHHLMQGSSRRISNYLATIIPDLLQQPTGAALDD